MTSTNRVCLHGLWTLVFAATVACDDTTEPFACTDQLVYGVQVEAVDSITGVDVEEGLAGTVVDGEYEEDMMVFDNLLWGAPEREGTYTVTVEAPGYADWTRTGVFVDADECHVIPAELEAKLKPAES